MNYSELFFKQNEVLTLSTELQESSPIYFGCKVEPLITDYLDTLSFDKLFLFCDGSVYPIHGKRLHERLASHYPHCELFIIPPGEQSKSFKMLEKICNELIHKEISKKSLIISFGGGVVGNLVGMAAGLIYRGVRFIEIPTTLTGQSDSILSNKQAINGDCGKNYFGFYYAPVFIWIDTSYLTTEPHRSRRSGLIEGVKNGLINDPDFLIFLDRWLRKDADYALEEIHSLSYNIILSKLEILRRDPSEKHEALILEYGHTFGHAIEWLAATKGDQSIQHGEAVAIGMKIAAELSYTLGYLDEDARDLHYHMIEERVGTHVQLPPYINSDLIIEGMKNDNKKTGRQIRFVLLERVGQCLNPEGDYLTQVDLNIVKNVLDDYFLGVHAERLAI